MRNPEKEFVVIPVAGAANLKFTVKAGLWPDILSRPLRAPTVKLGVVSTAGATFGPLTRQLRKHDIAVAHPIVLPKGGIDDMDNLYEYVVTKTFKRLEQNNANQAITLGHSAGGSMVTRMAVEYRDHEQLAGFIAGDPVIGKLGRGTLASVGGILTPISLLPGINLAPIPWLTSVNGFNDETRRMASQYQDEIHDTHIFGTGLPQYNLAGVDGAQVYNLAPTQHELLGEDGIFVQTPNEISHRKAMSDLAAVAFMMRLIGPMVERPELIEEYTLWPGTDRNFALAA